jgi:hypothetical protein
MVEKYCKKNGDNLIVQPLDWGNCGWYVEASELNGIVGRVLGYLTTPPPIVDLHIIVDLPLKFVNKYRFKAKKTIGITAGVEATKVDPQWVSVVNSPTVNKVIVPSKFTMKPFVDGGASTSKIEVIPESYFTELLSDQEHQIDIEPEHNVLFVSQVSTNPKLDRKNFFNTMRSIQGALSSLPDVGIVLKLNSAGRGAFDRINTRETVQKLKATMDIKNPITLIHGELNNSEMASLYQHPKISCLFTMTRGEGFGLPLLEAGVAGLPIIASDWSAHKEFLGNKFIAIPGYEVPVPQEKFDGVWVGGKWYDPDADVASRLLNRFFADEEYRKTSKENADILKKSLQSRYSLDKIYTSYENIFRSVLKR